MSKNFTEKMQKRAAENPAMLFITQPEPQAAEKPKKTSKPQRKTEASPLQAKINRAIDRAVISEDRPTPPRKEFKSRRLQLLIQPSLYEEIRSRAEAEGLSVNEEIHNLLRQALGN